MSGGGGTTTTTQSSTPFNSSQLLDVQNKAVNLGNTNPINYYPGQTYVGPNNLQTNALTNAGNNSLSAGDQLAGLTGPAQQTAITNNQNIAGGSGINYASPWLTGLGNTAAGVAGTGTGYLAGLAHGTAANALTDTATGKYLNSNPYLDGMFNSASDAVTRAYQTATAPQTASGMEAAGRFNSGASANADSVNQRNLGTSLDNLASNIYGSDYQNERGLMNTAAGNLGTLQNSIYSNLTTGENNAGLGALGGYGNLLTGQQNAINATPAQTGQPTTDYQAAVNSGNSLQANDQKGISDLIARYYGNEMAPWTTLQQEAGVVGGAIPGISTSTQPYYTNTAGQVLGGLTGAASLGSSLTGAPLLAGK